MQEVDDLISMLFHVIGFVKKHHDKVPRSVLKFYAYLNNNVKSGDFKEDKFQKLYKGCKAALLELVKDKKLIFDNETKEQEWFAKMDDLVEKTINILNLPAGNIHVFNSKQSKFLETNGAWLEEEVIRAFEDGQEFRIASEIWQKFQNEYGFGTQHEFYKNVLSNVSENVSDKLKNLFIHHKEPFFAKLVEILKRKGVLFLDKSSYFISGIADYDHEKNLLRFRENKIESDYITDKHEMIHAAFYNLPMDVQSHLRKLLDTEVVNIKKFLEGLDRKQLNFLYDKYEFKNLSYAISSSDEILAYLSDPAFANFVRDLKNGVLFPAGFLDRMTAKMRKKRVFETMLLEIERGVYSYYR